MKQLIKHLKEQIEKSKNAIKMFEDDIKRYEGYIEEIRLFKLKNFNNRLG